MRMEETSGKFSRRPPTRRYPFVKNRFDIYPALNESLDRKSFRNDRALSYRGTLFVTEILDCRYLGVFKCVISDLGTQGL